MASSVAATAISASRRTSDRAKPPRRWRRWRRRFLIGAGASVVGTMGLWIAIHEVPWLGPALAEGARDVFGPGAVAWLEDVAYGAADQVNLVVKGNSAPKTYWEQPEESGAAPADGSAEGAPTTDGEGRFVPPPFEPPFPEVATPADGRWLPFQTPGDERAPAVFRSLVHPDPKRPFAAVAVVAMDLEAVQLHVTAGTHEPKSMRVPEDARTGLIPDQHRDRLVAAFNGGFRAAHGNYGMRADGFDYIPPRDIACTLAFHRDGRLAIRTWTKLVAEDADLVAYRQTPPCLAEDGEPNPGLLHEFNRNWGATVSGETIIRRSAIGLDASGRILYYALGDAVTAQSIGRAMLVVGARDAAQLDVNYAYPRFVLFGEKDGKARLTEGLIPELNYKPTDFTIGPSRRDFFFVTRR